MREPPLPAGGERPTRAEGRAGEGPGEHRACHPGPLPLAPSGLASCPRHEALSPQAGRGEYGAPHSTLTPLALIGAAHFSISLVTNAARYSGERRSGATSIAPRPCSRSFTIGESIACSIASCS